MLVTVGNERKSSQILLLTVRSKLRHSLETVIIAVCAGILRMYRDILMRLDFIHLAQFLTRLPDNISGMELFDNIAQIRMTVDKQRFTQVLAVRRDREH
jgi:hypothetical protein